MLREAKHLDLAKTARSFASLRMTRREKGFSAKLLNWQSVQRSLALIMSNGKKSQRNPLMAVMVGALATVSFTGLEHLAPLLGLRKIDLSFLLTQHLLGKTNSLYLSLFCCSRMRCTA